MNKNKTEINKQSGFNLMELLFALVVIGGMVIGIVMMYNKNQNTSNARTIASDIQTLSSGVKSSYSADNTGFKEATGPNISNLGLIPSTISNKAGVMQNKYSGAVTVNPGTKCVAGDFTSCFVITEENLPAEVANKVLTQLGNEGMVAIDVNGTCVYSSGASGASETACTEGDATPYSTSKLAGALANPSKITVVYGQ